MDKSAKPDRLGVGHARCLDGVIVADNMYHYIKMSLRSRVDRMIGRSHLGELHEDVFKYGKAVYQEMPAGW